MAQATEAVIPNASQLILKLIRWQKYNSATMLQNNCANGCTFTPQL
jgi:glutathione peroxidase-family protein